ncbi:MAG: MMPL family transporter [Methylococcales bacterium]
MSNRSATFSTRFLSIWAHYTIKYTWWIILFGLVSSAASIYYAANNLGINTNTLEMISADLPFQINRNRLEKAFPQDKNAIVVVVNSSTPENSEYAIRELAERLSTKKDAIESIYIPGGEEFFKINGLLFLATNELEPLAQELTQAQPFLGRLAKDNSLNSLFGILSQAISEKDKSLPLDLDPFLTRIDLAVENTLAGIDRPISWQQLFLGEKSKTAPTQRFLLVSPKLDFSSVRAAETTMNALESVRQDLVSTNSDLKIRFTGEVALEYEELETISHGTSVAGLMSLILVCGTLLIGLHSFSLMIGALLTLFAGLAVSAAVATITVGSLNLVSIAFAVLYIGLGVDYAIHLILHFWESFKKTKSRPQAITEAIVRIGPSIFLCAVTTSVGFFAFVPTDYSGVSELGIISGCSMFVALLITLTLLPAILLKIPLRPIAQTQKRTTEKKWAICYEFPARHSWVVRIIALILAGYSLSLLSGVYFDSDPINMRDPHAESVVTFKELLKSKQDSPFTLTAMAKNKQSTLQLQTQLQKLDAVDSVITIFDFIPDHQEEKLALLEDLNFVLGSHLTHYPEPSAGDVEKQIAALRNFISVADTAINNDNNSPVLLRLKERLQNFLEKVAPNEEPVDADQVSRLQNNLLGYFAVTMNTLLTGLEAQPVENIDNLPPSLSERWLNPDGIYQILIFPKQDLNNSEHLKAFVKEVRQVAPDVTGLPVIYQESAATITDAFIQALTTALVAITFVLLLELRSIKDTVLVLVPLLLAACLTGAYTVISNSPLNYANIVAIPLLFGMGVDSGIHVIHRLRHMAPGDYRILQTSTARGVLFAALTTFFSFSSLAFTNHPGTSSMGELLAAGITFTLLSTLILLPALASKRKA